MKIVKQTDTKKTRIGDMPSGTVFRGVDRELYLVKDESNNAGLVHTVELSKGRLGTNNPDSLREVVNGAFVEGAE